MTAQPRNKRIAPSVCQGRKLKELATSILLVKYPIPAENNDIPKIHNITQRLILMPGLSKRIVERKLEEFFSFPEFLCCNLYLRSLRAVSNISVAILGFAFPWVFFIIWPTINRTTECLPSR